jgi:Transposase, Mutator family
VRGGRAREDFPLDGEDLRGYESAVRCLAEDLDALVVHLRYPLRHRERWRSTNLLEQSLGEVRRRIKVMGRFLGETSCLSLVWAVLDLFFSHATNGATFTDVDREHLLPNQVPASRP